MDTETFFGLVIIAIVIIVFVSDHKEKAEQQNQEYEAIKRREDNQRRAAAGVYKQDPYADHNEEWLNEGSYWDNIRQKVLDRDGHKCVRCGSKENLTVDHIIQLSIGGKNNLQNLQTLCQNCHEIKDGHKIFDTEFEHDDNYGKNYKLTPKNQKIVDAITYDKSLKVSYVDSKNKHTVREIWPKSIFKGYPNRDGKIVNKRLTYIRAYCELDNAERVFRLDRMKLS